MQRIWSAALAYGFCAGGFCASASAAPAAGSAELLLGAGVHYSQGTYGTGIRTRITALTFTGRYDTARWTFRGSVPYLFISGSDAVVPGIGRVAGASAAASSTSGLGDVTLSATYAAYHDAATQFGVDVTGKIKLATADPDERLGTGEHDLGVLAEVYKAFGRLTAFAGLGYTEFGTSPRLAISDAFSYTLGASYRLDERDSVGASYDERERLASGAAAQKELTVFYSRRTARGWRTQVYFLRGFADGSPDWGAGLSAAHPF
jgi:hypothetical protein